MQCDLFIHCISESSKLYNIMWDVTWWRIGRVDSFQPEGRRPTYVGSTLRLPL